jgi:hypothetical protein
VSERFQPLGVIDRRATATNVLPRFREPMSSESSCRASHSRTLMQRWTLSRNQLWSGTCIRPKQVCRREK